MVSPGSRAAQEKVPRQSLASLKAANLMWSSRSTASTAVVLMVAEAGGYPVPGQPGLHSMTLSQKSKSNKQKKRSQASRSEETSFFIVCSGALYVQPPPFPLAAPETGSAANDSALHTGSSAKAWSAGESTSDANCQFWKQYLQLQSREWGEADHRAGPSTNQQSSDTKGQCSGMHVAPLPHVSRHTLPTCVHTVQHGSSTTRYLQIN